MSVARNLASLFSSATDAATDVEVATAISSHSSAADPHTGYVLEAGGSTISVISGTTIPLKITNAGTGNSFLVEDSASTDSSPFLIDASGNVGVGSSSPSTFGKMAVVGGIYRVSESSGEEPIIVHSFGNGSYSSGMYSVNTFSGNFGNGLSFKTTDTSGSTAERVRISSAGRMLIGKTVDDTYNSFQLHTGFGLNGVGGYYTELNHNLIYSGGWKNAAQGPSSQIVMHGGSNLGSYIIFSTDPSSTSTAAGTASGVVERMRIDAAGKVFLSGIARDTSSQIRNITLSTSGASGGNDGDVWLTYTA